jgi:hypothetical protein
MTATSRAARVGHGETGPFSMVGIVIPAPLPGVVRRQITICPPGMEQHAHGRGFEGLGSGYPVEQSKDRAAQFACAVGFAQHRSAHLAVAVVARQIGKAGGKQHWQPGAQRARRIRQIDAVELPRHDDIGEQHIDLEIGVGQQGGDASSPLAASITR